MGSVIKKQSVFILTLNNDYTKMRTINRKKNRQREGYCITKKYAHVTRVTVKVFSNELLFSVEDSLKYNKTSTENNLVFLWVLRF